MPCEKWVEKLDLIETGPIIFGCTEKAYTAQNSAVSTVQWKRWEGSRCGRTIFVFTTLTMLRGKWDGIAEGRIQRLTDGLVNP